MTIRKYYLSFIACLLVICLLPSDSFAAKRKVKRRYFVSAKTAILYDSRTGRRLYDKNANSRILPASTTKVMTALLVLERLPLNKVITISKEATNVQPTKAGLIAGEHYTVANLLYAALMQSANDAAVALAEAVAGSQGEFVKLMNQRAAQLGAKGTKFANSNGLPTREAQYSTAYDMSLILRAALKYPFFKEVLTFKNRIITSQEGRVIPIKSYNKLLSKHWQKPVYGKTGYTRRARYCFLGFIEKEKNIYIIGVFGCSKRWQDILYIISKFGGMRL